MIAYIVSNMYNVHITFTVHSLFIDWLKLVHKDTALKLVWERLSKLGSEKRKIVRCIDYVAVFYQA